MSIDYRERKTLTFAADLKVLAKSADYPDGALEGYGSTFGNVDLGGDVVMPGAFTKTLKDNLRTGSIKLIDGHNTYTGTQGVIGVVTEAREDTRGLWFKAKFSGTTLAQEVRQKVREGILNSLSIGYGTIRENLKDTHRELLELKLWEISVVAWGMNPEAGITGAKSDSEVSAMLRDMREVFTLADVKSTAVLMQRK